MTAPITLESLKKSATSTLARKYSDVFGEPSSEMTRADMISALWTHYSEHGEEQVPEIAVEVESDFDDDPVTAVLPELEVATVAELLDEAYEELAAAIGGEVDDEESVELGEKYHRILTAEDVRQIREMRATGISYKKIATQYGVSHTFIRNIVMRRLYKDVK